jgi:hypothetical protein
VHEISNSKTVQYHFWAWANNAPIINWGVLIYLLYAWKLNHGQTKKNMGFFFLNEVLLRTSWKPQLKNLGNMLGTHWEQTTKQKFPTLAL